MRIWHESLIPHLCQKHLCAMWRESLGAYKIITENKKGYRNHPAVKEFEHASLHLWFILLEVRNEMLKRGYNPKELPCPIVNNRIKVTNYKFVNMAAIAREFKKEKVNPWQSLPEQIEVLKAKKCKCNI